MSLESPTGPAYTRTARRLGVASAAIIVVGGCLYGAVLVAGLWSLTSPRAPIGDPWFAIMELIILVVAPAMVTLFAALRAWAPPHDRRLSLLAVALMAAASSLTCAVHLVLLIGTPRATAGLAFQWPSTPYALDILAWDVLFAASVLLMATQLRGGRETRLARCLLLASGVLAAVGLAGVPLGDMRVRDIGIVGYGVIFPITAGLLLRLFLRTPAVSGPR